MNRSTLRDFGVGLFLLGGLVAIAFLSINVGGLAAGGGGDLLVHAHFDETGGLKPRAQVAISGVKVGRVRSITLDSDYRADVTLALDEGLALPTDTSASIVTAGLLGDRYVVLQRGAEETTLKSGDTITFTEPAVLLERMLGKLIHNTDVTK